MTTPESSKPRLPGGTAMTLRIVAVIVGYLIYRLVDEPLVSALLIAIGFVMLTWAVIERETTFRKDRLSIMIAGQAMLGLGLVAAGVVTKFT